MHQIKATSNKYPLLTITVARLGNVQARCGRLQLVPDHLARTNASWFPEGTCLLQVRTPQPELVHPG